MKKEKGFNLLELLICFVVVGFVGYLLWGFVGGATFGGEDRVITVANVEISGWGTRGTCVTAEEYPGLRFCSDEPALVSSLVSGKRVMLRVRRHLAGRRYEILAVKATR